MLECILVTIRCRKFILGRDILAGSVGVQYHGMTLISRSVCCSALDL